MTDRLHVQVELSAVLINLALDPAWLDGIAASLELLAFHAARVMATPLPPCVEPAPAVIP